MYNKINLKSNFNQKITTPFDDGRIINIDGKTTINFSYIANPYLYISKAERNYFSAMRP